MDGFYPQGNHVIASASLLSESGQVLETHTYRGHFTFPYVSGIFFLHEGPFVVAAVRGLKERPHLVCFDAHGISHPRYLGLATICGMVLDIPSIGCAKSKLVGDVRPYKEGLDKIVLEDTQVGFVTRYEGVKRYWSPGFLVSMDELEGIILDHSEVCLKSIAEADQVGRSGAYAH